MENEVIYTLTETFEGHAQATENGVEYWLARDLQHLLGYTKWDNFLNVVSKAKTACEISGHEAQDHFADVGKMVDLGSDGKGRGFYSKLLDFMTKKYDILPSIPAKPLLCTLNSGGFFIALIDSGDYAV
ncbi:MAG: hypothetical protein U1F16_13435 [Turneriella sp.]